MTDDSVAAVVERLRGVLEDADATYAFGGAVALAAWSEPGATADVDVILWVDPEREIDRAIELVRRAGVELDDAVARATAEQRGSFVRDSLVDMLGEDERIAKWDEICARV